MSPRLSKCIYGLLIMFIFSFISCQDQTNPVSNLDELDHNGSNKVYGSFNVEAIFIETLAPFSPYFPSGYASGMIVEGIGMLSQPSSLTLDIPSGVTIENVFVYWVGKGNEPDGGDNTIVVDGTEVTGLLIGTSLPIKGDIVRYSYRGDLTNLSLDFNNPIELDGVQFSGKDARADGAAIVVIYSDENTGTSDIVIHDGADFAWLCAPSDSDPKSFYTEEQTFTFPQSDQKRYATLSFMVGDAESIDRPDRLVVTIDGDTKYYEDVLNGSSGAQFDVVKQTILIPTGITEVKVKVESGPGDCDASNTPESLIWIFSGLSIYNPPEISGCTYTQGYWKNHPEDWPVEELKIGNNTYTKQELLLILKQPVKGNGLVSLSHQLIATKLNLAKGANGSSIMNDVIAADLLIGSNWIPPVGEGYFKPKDTSSLNDKLDSYNKGVIGPGHCNKLTKYLENPSK